MSEFDPDRMNRQMPAFRDMDIGGKFKRLLDGQDALDSAINEVKGLEQHTVQQFFLVAADTTITPFVPSGVNGALTAANYTRVAAPTSALGTITAQFRDGNGNAVTNALTIDGAAAAPFVLADDGAFVNGLFLHVTSDDGDATQGTGLRAAARYTVTHPES